jgi:hypothetical protein
MIGRQGGAIAVLSDGSIMIMGGCADNGIVGWCTADDVWKSENGGTTWSLVTWNPGWVGKEQTAAGRVSYFINSIYIFLSPHLYLYTL